MAPQKYGVPIAKGSANPDHSRLKGRLVKGSRPAVRVDLNSKKTFSLDQATEVDDPDPIRIVFTRPLSPSAQTKTSQAKTDNSTGARSTADRRPLQIYMARPVHLQPINPHLSSSINRPYMSPTNLGDTFSRILATIYSHKYNKT